MKKYCGYCGSALKTAAGENELEVPQKIINALKSKPVLLFADENFEKNLKSQTDGLKKDFADIVNPSIVREFNSVTKENILNTVKKMQSQEERKKLTDNSTLVLLVESDKEKAFNVSSLLSYINKNNLSFKPVVLQRDKRTPITLVAEGKSDVTLNAHIVALSLAPEKK